MKCIIIDDEPLALNVIKSYCEDIGTLEIMGTYTNAVEAMQVMQSQEVDLVFSDIEMPQINGIDFIKALDKKPLFIFTTAYPQYALEGFELNAVDYLVKPIPFSRFLKAVNRAKEMLQLKNNAKPFHNMNVSPAFGTTSTEKKTYMFVKSEYDNVKIEFQEIKYVQGLKDYLKIHTTRSNKPILTLMSFKEMQTHLPEEDFFRVHKSFIVNIGRIDSIQRSKIVIDDIRIPIGESYKSDFYGRIGL
ncbi:LytTR family DNA-binding domain-containing protein [Aureisphaera galaxeae]|uniref:LytR/AlgR family response regulator transcription factor n=1 Tax=Aureisphaera galaxeae TaxID=1538023 RepID=UPI00234FD7A5|nr:LytTR family DNA-binding domain-containing protein [Aureisphaera galaxeae]MDC8004825.1 LytTR family DNA-binding domain-containing protein [Aureisphaera galaxeae]